MIRHLSNLVNSLHESDAGQSLVEYLLLLALIGFATTAGMRTVASGVNSAFAQVGVIVGAYIT